MGVDKGQGLNSENTYQKDGLWEFAKSLRRCRMILGFQSIRMALFYVVALSPGTLTEALERTFSRAQCDIIQGLLLGKLFDPSGRYNVLLDRLEPPLQQPQPGPWVLVRLGLSAARSLVSWARRVVLDTADRAGTLSMTRGAEMPQTGQSQGSEKRLIGIISSKTPQSSQRYSYTGMGWPLLG